MKKVLVVLLVLIISMFLYFNFTKPTIINSYTGFKEYHELSNGKWQCEEEIYPYKLEFHDDTNGHTYIVLSHHKNAEYGPSDLSVAIFSSIVPYELDQGEAIVVDYNE